MGSGSFELGKFVHKEENWEKLRGMKSAIPISKHSQIYSSYYFVSVFGKHSDLILGLKTLRKCSVFKASFKNFQSLFSKLPNWDFFLVNWE